MSNSCFQLNENYTNLGDTEYYNRIKTFLNFKQPLTPEVKLCIEKTCLKHSTMLPDILDIATIYLECLKCKCLVGTRDQNSRILKHIWTQTEIIPTCTNINEILKSKSSTLRILSHSN